MSEDKITPKILLVDDKPENLLSLEMTLEDADAEIFKSSNGNDALKLALKHDFAVILSDVQMPEMNGFEFVEILRTNPKNQLIPIIFVTAISKEDKYVHRGYAEGAVDYLFKPLDPDIVRTKVSLFLALDRQKVQLEKQNKLLKQLNVQKNRFMGMAAHDLRNPLNVIHHYSTVLLSEKRDGLDTEIVAEAEIIHSSARFMLDLVEELLDITKIESGTFSIYRTPVAVEQLIDKSIKMNQLTANAKNIKLKHTYKGSEELMSMLDSSKINQILNNLLSNAIKYSESGTQVEVITEMDRDHLVLRVTDHGQGIPEEEITKLFKAFETTSVHGTAGEKSTGLGLAIVHKIVEAHNGEITVKSTVGKGSVFTIRLPIMEVDESYVQPVNTPDQREAISVVLAEDSSFVQRVLKSIFKPFKVDLSLVNNGAELIAYVEEHPETTLIFTDLNMPEVGGLEAISQIRDKGINIPAIGLSATMDQKTSDRCIESGMQECYDKMISEHVLGQLLKKYCGYNE